MDIRKISASKKTTKVLEEQVAQSSQFTTGVIQTADAKLMIPKEVRSKLSALSKKYGLSFDLSNISLEGKMADNVKAIRQVADMVTGDSKLLPEMMKQIKRLMRAEIKLAQFHKLVVKESIKHQEKMDKQTADIFLAMAGYQAKSTKLEHRTNVRNQLKERRTAAYSNYYQNSVFGAESAIIDVEFSMLESNRKILTASKSERVELNKVRKSKIDAYVQSAFQ